MSWPGQPYYHPRPVSWVNALGPWLIAAVFFYVGILVSYWRALRKGKYLPSETLVRWRRRGAILFAALAVAGLALLAFVVWKAALSSRHLVPSHSTVRALWTGLIPVLSVLAAAPTAILLFVRPVRGGTPDAVAAGPPGEPCVRCGNATAWNEGAQRFRCTRCKLYQPAGPKAT